MVVIQTEQLIKPETESGNPNPYVMDASNIKYNNTSLKEILDYLYQNSNS